MSILESFSLAFKNIVSSKMRTFLTMLGIIIGVAAVTVIVGLGNGLEGYVTDSFADMGTDTLTVSVQSRGSTRTLEVEDMYEIVEESEYLNKCSPTATMPGFVKIGTETTSSSVTGVSEDYFDMMHYNVTTGRGILYSDIASRSRICVVGAYVNLAYYGGNAVGDTLRINGTSYTIVGVLEQQLDNDDLEEGCSDDCIYLPYSTASRVSGRISSYTLTVYDEDYIDEGKEAVEAALYAFFEDDDFYTVTSMSELVETMTSMINIIVGILSGIAAISLVVGGIGIMNIMLVSVTERTREIGIRKSLGAKERYIMQQFVIEAACTSSLGGVVGIVLGYILSALASVVAEMLLGESLTISPTGSSVALAFGISVGIGIVFGYLPAKKAAGLNPIDALHYD
ncbi:MAG: ABC transporter permease [Oscillospiraceae bacterium]|nr:ABC transporter permease [Oscillospiraceae bacterium]MCD8373840.1 ABC transporter permease [Oscillospiraceae bacterium]